jgi:hypothetical protein
LAGGHHWTWLDRKFSIVGRALVKGSSFSGVTDLYELKRIALSSNEDFDVDLLFAAQDWCVAFPTAERPDFERLHDRVPPQWHRFKGTFSPS